jgi:hypothetical protein
MIFAASAERYDRYSLFFAIMTTRHGDCALLVSSCDGYGDLWRPFFTLLGRHWRDCPFPVYLGAGEITSRIPGVICLGSTGGKDWSRCMLQHLSQIPHSWVLVVLDDFFLRRAVDTRRILHAFEFVRERQGMAIRLVPRPPPTRILPDRPEYGVCSAEADYRINAQATLWNKRELEALLSPGEGIWEFEHRATERARARAAPVYCVRRAALPYEGLLTHHVIEKGRWFPHEKWRFREPQLGCDFSRRGTLSWRHVAIYQTAHAAHRLLGLIPGVWRGKATNFVRDHLGIGLRTRLARYGVVDARQPHRKGS